MLSLEISFSFSATLLLVGNTFSKNLLYSSGVNSLSLTYKYSTNTESLAIGLLRSDLLTL